MKTLLCALISFVAFSAYAQERDPYHSDGMKFYNPEQIDFSSEFFNYTANSARKAGRFVSNEIREQGYSFDAESLFCTPDYHQNGVLGSDYRRIRVHISEATSKRVGYVLIFQLKGKTNVRGNICDFDGKVSIDGIYKFKDSEDEGIMVGHYELSENKEQTHSGTFDGTFVCSIIIDSKTKTITLDERNDIADGYSNRDYVGFWKSYEGKTKKKCIWGDYRLPYTFDFDIGDGEMMVNEKYVKNGWQSYAEQSEFYLDNESGRVVLKEHWWK